VSLRSLRNGGGGARITANLAANLLTSLLTSVVVGAGLGCSRRTPGAEIVRRPAAIAVLPARADDLAGSPAGAQRPPAPPTPLTVQVDTLQPQSADMQSLTDALDGVIPGPSASDAPQDRPAAPDWLVWGHLDGARWPVSLNARVTFAPNSLGLYAAGNAECKTVCLVNRSQERVWARVQVRLPRGIYTIERLTLARPAERHEAALAVPGDAAEKRNAATLRTVEQPPAGDSDPVFHLERLQGSDLRRPAVVAKMGVLEPGQAVFYRFTDQSRLVEAAFADCYRQLAVLERSRPGAAHRLRRMLNEGEPYRGGAHAGGGDVDRRLESIHRLLLVTGQAQSLHHNYQLRGVVESETGAALMGSLERVMDGLAEISATLLGLAPQIQVETPSSKIATGQNSSVTQPGHAVASRLVTISLANGGERAVGMVKLGLDSSELPTNVVCDPPDPAFFGVLKPGQTVRAQFRLRCPSDQAIVERRCVADVCYRAGGGPAHLRQRPW
jgi:hypothetical protein